MEKEIKRSNNTNESGNIENRLENDTWKEMLKSLSMPEQIKQALMRRKEKSERKGSYRLRYAKVLPAVCLALIIACTGITAHAVYMNTHFSIFFEPDITNEQLSRIESELEQMEGISSWRYVDGDTAWKEFSEAYLTPELEAQFEDNPLADCANYEAAVFLNADTAQMIAYFEKLDGVRKVSRFSEEE